MTAAAARGWSSGRRPLASQDGSCPPPAAALSVRSERSQGAKGRVAAGSATQTPPLQFLAVSIVPISALAAGLLAERLGLRTGLVVVVAGLAATTLMRVCSPVRQVRRLPTPTARMEPA